MSGEYDMVCAEMKRLDMDMRPFQWFLDLRKNGSVPHGGGAWVSSFVYVNHWGPLRTGYRAVSCVLWVKISIKTTLMPIYKSYRIIHFRRRWLGGQ